MPKYGNKTYSYDKKGKAELRRDKAADKKKKPVRKKKK
tara:strand:- start:1809 stop:1922 length:114 start_codon:yes stop_codon:yes gene_type:complete